MNHLTLGELIDAIEQIIAERPGAKDDRTYFDFGYFHPDGLGSWRGIYSHLAISYGEREYEYVPLLGGFLKELQGAVGSTYDGYKGGEYEMSRDTPVWVANYGEGNSTAVVGVKDCGYQIIIQTAYAEP